MADGLVVVHLSNKPTVPVTQVRSGYPRLLGEHQIQQLLRQQLLGVKNLIPAVEIFDSRVKPCCCVGNGHISVSDLFPMVVKPGVPRRQVAIVMIVAGILHLQRLKDILLQERLIRLAGDLFDNVTQHNVA